MRPAPACSRRLFLLSGAAARAFSAEHAPSFPAEWKRYPDPVTEFEVLRLTDPTHTTFLPWYYAAAVSRHGGFMLVWSDRTGSTQGFRIDMRNGEWRQVTHVDALDGRSLTLLPDERGFCYFDGAVLRLANLGTLRTREVYRVPDGWERCEGASVTSDGRYALIGEKAGTKSRLQLIDLRGLGARTVTQEDWILAHPLANPRRAQILYRSGDESLWLVNFDGRQGRRLKLADGSVGPAAWAPDGRTVLYLNFPADKAQLNAIREYTPDQNTDRMVAKTSQFTHFGFNRNSSVFVGASRNQASPTVLLLLRLTRREFTLCEHKASDTAMVAPIFSPDSQRIFFVSDRHGKPAVYTVKVDKLVEKTDES